jgi:dihydroorotate dehydrogenase
VAQVRDSLSPRVPLLVKIAPDLTESEMDDVLGAIALAGIDGIIATNTSVGREGLPVRYQELKGGLSGAPLRARSTDVIRYIARRTAGKLPIVGVGGIASPDDAIEKLDAGATLLQVYTGLVYAGPGLVRRINRALAQHGCHATT